MKPNTDKARAVPAQRGSKFYPLISITALSKEFQGAASVTRHFLRGITVLFKPTFPGSAAVLHDYGLPYVRYLHN